MYLLVTCVYVQEARLNGNIIMNRILKIDEHENFILQNFTAKTRMIHLIKYLIVKNN